MTTYQLTLQRLVIKEATVEIEAESLEDAISEFSTNPFSSRFEVEFGESAHYEEEIDRRIFAAKAAGGEVVVEDKHIGVRWKDLSNLDFEDECPEGA